MTDAKPPRDVSDAKSARAESFEATVGRLEEIVRTLEKGELPLERALDAYAEGVELAKRAQGKLDGMDRRLEQLLASGQAAPMKPPPGDERPDDG